MTELVHNASRNDFIKAALLCAGIAVLTLTFADPSAGQQDRSPAPPAISEAPEAAERPATIGPAADDAEVATRLRRILEATGWFGAPRVSVSDGIVTIEGTTDREEYRRWAGELAENTPGTLAVVNRIVVDADIGSTFGRASEELSRLYDRAVGAWPLAVLAVIIVLTTWLIARSLSSLARRLLSDRISSPLLLTLAVRTISVPVIILGVYFVLQVADLTGLAITVLGGTGLIGIVIGFAFRDIAENFLASLLLSMRNPFRNGDLIDVAGHTGIVQSLNTRSTILLTLDGNHVQIPNATVFKSTIKNYSSIPSRRAEFMIGIGYTSSSAKAQTLIAEVLGQHPAVLDVPEPLVLVDELGAATVNLRVSYWFDSATYSPAKINSSLLRQAKNVLLKNGIELPDPAREVVFPQGVPLFRREMPPQPGRPSHPDADAERREEETTTATVGEGDLSSESAEMQARSGGRLPEDQENLLKE